MIQMLATMMTQLIKLPFVAKFRTPLAAIGLIALCIWMLSVGQYEAGFTNLFFALGLLGLHFSFTPDKPMLPGDPALTELLDQAEVHDHINPPKDESSMAVLGLLSPNRAEFRRSRRQEVITGLSKAGVSKGVITAWLPIIMALLQVMPDVLAVIQKILDAIKNGKNPTQFARDNRLALAK